MRSANDRPRIAIATCAEHPHLAADDLPLLAELRARGVGAEPLVWNGGEVDWSGLDGCLLRSVWDYHLRRADFLAWSEAVVASVPLWNRPELIAWNTDKRYLRELGEAGVPTIPTAWIARGEEARLEDLLAERGWSEAVLKPTVDLGAERLARVGAGVGDGQVLLDALLAEHEVMAQPFLPSVASRGEVSLVFFEGELSHAVRKLPREGDFRVQPKWGGSVAAAEPGAAQRRVAEAALAVLGEPPLYARADLLEGEDGESLLIELELVEPNLYLATDQGAASRLAAALAARLHA
jgi:glutathione synthase/RimK-type ligase-like ATP-grasp enzyme